MGVAKGEDDSKGVKVRGCDRKRGKVTVVSVGG